MKFRPFFYLLSFILLCLSFFSITKWGFTYGIDFVGGSSWNLQFSQNVDKSRLEKVFSQNNLKINNLSINGKTVLIKFSNISQDKKVELSKQIAAFDKDYKELKFESLGPSLGKELIQKTIVAIILSTLALLLFIGSKFNDFTFGLAAILAMFHDSIILIGCFSFFGHLFGAELDALFVTALLTTLSASVHDTVVTFDRIRELKRKNFRLDWVNLANQAVSEVIVRSINNSMTIIFMLTALVVLGGETTKWFALALLIGVISGTYSSTGVAIPLVLFFKKLKK